MSEHPNLLFIFTDQHKPQVTGWEGDPLIRTPNLDRLAAEGVVFDCAYSQNPLCVPSRSSMITGQYCRSIGIYENQDILEPNCTTFPRLLSEAGYRTCLIGKAHFNGDPFHGYQERPYGDLFGQGHQPDPRRDPRGESGLGGMVANAGVSGIPLPMTQTEICVAEASKWLQAHAGLHGQQPFLLSLQFDKPHFPLRCPAPYFKRYEGRVPVPELPAGYRDRVVPFVRLAIDRFNCRQEAWATALAAYYGCIEWVDDAVGRVLQVLEYLGLRENTLVVYASDHGELGGEHGAWNKTLFFDACNRVPLVMSWPSRFAAGRRCAVPVGLLDVFPTLCEVAGVPAPPSCEGISLVPALTGTGMLTRERIYSESAFLGQPSVAGCMVRTPRWKYNLYLDGAEELYDMSHDPGEWENLAATPEHGDTVRGLRADVTDFWRPAEYLQRLQRTPKVRRQRHCYPYSDQFMLGNGTVVDGRP